MWLLPHSNTMINHSLSALLRVVTMTYNELENFLSLSVCAYLSHEWTWRSWRPRRYTAARQSHRSCATSSWISFRDWSLRDLAAAPPARRSAPRPWTPGSQRQSPSSGSADDQTTRERERSDMNISMSSILLNPNIMEIKLTKAGVPLSDFKECDGIGVDEHYRMHVCSNPIRFFVPTARPIGYDFCYVYPIVHFAQW